MMDDCLLVTKRTSTEGVRQSPPLLSMDDWVSNSHDARVFVRRIEFWIVPLVFEEAWLAMFRMTVYISVGPEAGEGKIIWASSYDVS